MHPALTNAIIGQPINVLEQRKPDHEAGLDSGSALIAAKRCDLAVDHRANHANDDSE